ncbi:hypothetical protein ACWD3Z_00635 [Streptomyces sp. NPDC002740]
MVKRVGDEVDLGSESSSGTSQALADLATSSSLTASFRNTGSTWFVPRPGTVTVFVASRP